MRQVELAGTTYVYLTAEDWGMWWDRPPATERLDDKEGYIHHSAGNPFKDWDGAAAFQEMNRRAIQSKGYSAIDYDGMVHYNPHHDVCTIGMARGRWRSAAQLDRNQEGEAWCALGYFHPGHSLSERPHPAIIEGLARGFAWSIELGHLSPNAVMLGHRDNPAHPGATGCPGDYLYPYVRPIGVRVRELLQPQPPEDTMTFPARIIKPPPEYAGSPWFAVEGGAVRYADSFDNEIANAKQLEKIVPSARQYEFMHMDVFGSLPKR